MTIQYYRPGVDGNRPCRWLVWSLILATMLALAGSPRLIGSISIKGGRPGRPTAVQRNRDRCGPRLLVIGSQKGGTTSLYKYMKRFPWIGRGTKHGAHKELHFFDKWYQRSTKSPAELGEEDIRNLQVEYLGKFGWTPAPSGGASGNQTCHDARTGNTFDVGGADPNTVLSDVTPRYIIVPDAAALADRISDHPWIVALVREPASRALSHFQMEWRERYEGIDGGEAMLRDSAAFAEEFEMHVRQGIKVSRDCLTSFPKVSAACHHRGMSHVADFVWRGLYAVHLDPWIRQFGRNKVLLWVSEEFSSGPRGHLTELQRRVWDGPQEELGEEFAERFNVDEHVVFPRPESMDLLKQFYREYNAALCTMLRRWGYYRQAATIERLW